MRKLYWRTFRYSAMITAGTLMQAGGCAVDGQAILNEAAINILQALVSTFVFQSFNLIP